MNKVYKLLSVAFCLIIISCSKSDDAYIPVEESPVVMDLTQVPYPKLSDYKFFQGTMSDQNPAIGVLPYKPTSELFTDYAKKSRFVWLPSGTKTTYSSDDDVLSLPIGGCLIKTFYYDNIQPSNTKKIIETRLLIKKDTGWIFADYVWNEQQTEAFLDLNGSTVPLEILHNGSPISINYKIPTASDCFLCHAVGGLNKPIGIKPQNLNSNYSYSSGSMNQLAKWISVGILDNNLPSTIQSVVDYNDVSKSLDLRVRSYFDIQCSHCHQVGGNAEYVNLRMAFSQTSDPAMMGVCLNPALLVPGIVHGRVVQPSDVANSTLNYMVTTNNPSLRMPRLGRTVVHQEGVDLIQQWINSLGTPCE
jgi:uncharacterized repeat protein (TIGR03806 family)